MVLRLNVKSLQGRWWTQGIDHFPRLHKTTSRSNDVITASFKEAVCSPVGGQQLWFFWVARLGQSSLSPVITVSQNRSGEPESVLPLKSNLDLLLIRALTLTQCIRALTYRLHTQVIHCRRYPMTTWVLNLCMGRKPE